MENMASKLGVCNSIFILNLELWKGQELPRIILLRTGLLTFNFHFPKTQDDVFIFIIFWPSANVHASRNQLCRTLALQNNFKKNTREIPHRFKQQNGGISESQKRETCGKDACREILEIRRMISWISWVWSICQQMNICFSQLNSRNLKN